MTGPTPGAAKKSLGERERNTFCTASTFRCITSWAQPIHSCQKVCMPLASTVPYFTAASNPCVVSRAERE